MNHQGVDHRYQGIRGWLAVLCILLVGVRPLFGLARIGALLESYPSSGVYDGLTRAIIIEMAMVIILTLYSIYAGLRLWRRSPSAVWTAKSYFVLEIIIAIGIGILYVTSVNYYPSEKQWEVFRQNCLDVLKTAIAAGIWLLYLSKSKRVAATYSQQARNV